MEKTLTEFKKWKVDIPAQRRALYVHSTHQFNEENVLYMICCWDYIFHPSDSKLEGLVRVFIEDKAPAMINVSAVNRRKALALLQNPLTVTKWIKGDASEKRTAISKLSNAGGAQVGGVGNYNLMTQAIEMTLEQCMGKVDDANAGDNMLSLLAAKGAGSTQPSARGRRIVQAISQYWGAAIVDLGLT